MPSEGSVLLVGSVPLSSTSEVLGTCADILGSRAAAFPDGETGDRSQWIVYQAYRVFHGHPQLETVRRPDPIEGVEQWEPTSLENLWDFRIRDGEKLVTFDDLRYCSAAEASYEQFCRLRADGTIPVGRRFQVCLPFPESVLVFFRDREHLRAILPAYRDAMEAEVAKIVDAIPPEDLLIQWDVCSELLDIEGVFPWSLDGEPGPEGRYLDNVRRTAQLIPEDVEVGYHLCYADLGHRHMKEPDDLGLCVRLANETIAHSPRRVDFFHMPVPRNRSDDDYFVPLETLDIGNAKVYLGLTHHTDGEPGGRERIRAAQRHIASFGIATECGLGRRPAEQVRSLLALQASLADQLTST